MGGADCKDTVCRKEYANYLLLPPTWSAFNVAPAFDVDDHPLKSMLGAVSLMRKCVFIRDCAKWGFSGKENDFLFLKGRNCAHFDGIVSVLVDGGTHWDC